MRTLWIEPAYEPIRTWALEPSALRPPGVAHILRGGIVTWIQVTIPLPAVQSSESHTTAHFATMLSTIVAAMIGEVCR